MDKTLRDAEVELSLIRVRFGHSGSGTASEALHWARCYRQWLRETLPMVGSWGEGNLRQAEGLVRDWERFNSQSDPRALEGLMIHSAAELNREILGRWGQ